MDPFAYSSESDREQEFGAPKIDLAPKVEIPRLNEINSISLLVRPNHITGSLSTVEVEDFEFSKQYHTYQNFGYANPPSDPRTIITTNAPNLENEWRSIFQKSSKSRKQKRIELKDKRLKNDDPTSPDFKGPWAHYEGEQELYDGRFQVIDEEQKKKLAEYEEKRKKVLQNYIDNPEIKEYEETPINFIEPQVIPHFEEAVDYQGRYIFHPPSELKPDPIHTAYIPKKCALTLAGHTEKIECIKFIPIYGHLVITGSLDKTIKVWDVNSRKKCLQTYVGHSSGIRDICWNNDGTEFLSSSFDRLIRLWDTETGKVKHTFKCRKVGYCIRYNPDPDKHSAFIAGTMNKKIVQYDTLSGKKVQSYEEHLNSITSLCFVDNNSKFVSTSDDKKVFLWEFGIPIVAKHISEPTLNTIVYTALHPSGRHFVGQSLDNILVVFEARGGFRLNRRKKFSGHQLGGFSCAASFSPDGQFICSGDNDGRIFFWDWKTNKLYYTIQAHNDNVIGIDWHPIYPSVVATCSWDGVVKIWD